MLSMVMMMSSGAGPLNRSTAIFNILLLRALTGEIPGVRTAQTAPGMPYYPHILIYLKALTGPCCTSALIDRRESPRKSSLKLRFFKIKTEYFLISISIYNFLW